MPGESENLHMDTDIISEIIGKVSDGEGITSDEIPSIDLYLDQILTMVSGRINLNGKNPLTKTMINNYSKDGLIKPVKGKKYSKEHIVQMLIIYYLKSSLSMSDIKRVLGGVYSAENFDGEKLIGCYDKFISLKKKQPQFCDVLVRDLIAKEGLDPTDSNDYFILLMLVATFGDYLKNAALGLLDAGYPLPPKLQKNVKEKKTKKTENSEKANLKDISVDTDKEQVNVTVAETGKEQKFESDN